MKFTVNGLDIEVIEEISGITLRINHGPTSRAMPTPSEPVAITPKHGDLEVLSQLGLTMKSIVQIANKVLGYDTTGDKIESAFPTIREDSIQFAFRKIKEPIWALYLAPIKLPVVGETIAAAGLNEENQIVFLGCGSSEGELYKDIIKRGVVPAKIKLGVLSFGISDRKLFEKTFPKAKIELDWYEFRSSALVESNKELITRAMGMDKKAPAQKLIASLKAPPELFTHFEFDPGIQRAIRSTAPLKRIESDLKKRFKSLVLDEEQAELALAWGLMRLQYHWYKIPADAKYLEAFLDG